MSNEKVVVQEEENVAAPSAPSFAFTPAAIAYDKTASQATGALCTGMGYDPKTLATATVNSKYMGGAAQVIGFYDPTP